MPVVAHGERPSVTNLHRKHCIICCAILCQSGDHYRVVVGQHPVFSHTMSASINNPSLAEHHRSSALDIWVEARPVGLENDLGACLHLQSNAESSSSRSDYRVVKPVLHDKETGSIHETQGKDRERNTKKKSARELLSLFWVWPRAMLPNRTQGATGKR